jgi:hypothetical protein
VRQADASVKHFFSQRQEESVVVTTGSSMILLETVALNLHCAVHAFKVEDGYRCSIPELDKRLATFWLLAEIPLEIWRTLAFSPSSCPRDDASDSSDVLTMLSALTSVHMNLNVIQDIWSGYRRPEMLKILLGSIIMVSDVIIKSGIILIKNPAITDLSAHSRRASSDIKNSPTNHERNQIQAMIYGVVGSFLADVNDGVEVLEISKSLERFNDAEGMRDGLCWMKAVVTEHLKLPAQHNLSSEFAWTPSVNVEFINLAHRQFILLESVPGTERGPEAPILPAPLINVVESLTPPDKASVSIAEGSAVSDKIIPCPSDVCTDLFSTNTVDEDDPRCPSSSTVLSGGPTKKLKLPKLSAVMLEKGRTAETRTPSKKEPGKRMATRAPQFKLSVEEVDDYIEYIERPILDTRFHELEGHDDHGMAVLDYVNPSMPVSKNSRGNKKVKTHPVIDPQRDGEDLPTSLARSSNSIYKGRQDKTGSLLGVNDSSRPKKRQLKGSDRPPKTNDHNSKFDNW